MSFQCMHISDTHGLHLQINSVTCSTCTDQFSSPCSGLHVAMSSMEYCKMYFYQIIKIVFQHTFMFLWSAGQKPLVAYFTKWKNENLANQPFVFNGGLLNVCYLGNKMGQRRLKGSVIGSFMKCYITNFFLMRLYYTIMWLQMFGKNRKDQLASKNKTKQLKYTKLSIFSQIQCRPFPWSGNTIVPVFCDIWWYICYIYYHFTHLIRDDSMFGTYFLT